MIRKLMAASALSLAAAAPAHAASFFVQHGVIAASEQPIPSNNSFQADLLDLQLTHYLYGMSVYLTGPATVNIEYLGAESGYNNTFHYGSSSFTETADANLIDTPQWVNSIAISGGPGNIDLTPYFRFSGPGIPGGIGGEGFSILETAAQAALNQFETNVLYLAYDDQEGNGPPQDDDNHDDMIIRLTIAPVPEPATWAMMIAGFGFVGATLRRRETRAALTATG